MARRTPTGFEVVFERHFPQPPARVWAMLTEPESVGTWFCARVEIDRRLGGRIVEHHGHVGVDVLGKVTRWEPPQAFEHTWWFEGSRETPGGRVLWELFRQGSGTRLVLTHRRASLDGGGMAGAHVGLDVLAAVLGGADPSEHAPPEGVFQDGRFVQSRPGRGLWAEGARLEQAYSRDFADL